MDLWRGLADMLLDALAEESRAVLANPDSPTARLDAVKDIVAIAQRLFALDKAIPAPPDPAAVQRGFVPAVDEISSQLDEVHRLVCDGSVAEASALLGDTPVFPGDCAADG